VVEHEKLTLQMSQAEAAHQAAQAAYEQAEKLAKIRMESQIAQARAQLAGAESAYQQVLDLAETRALSQTGQAEAALASLQANLEKIIRGAREEDRKQVQAAVDQAKANLANAKSNYARMEKLFESSAISIQSFEQAETQLDIAQAQYDIAIQQMTLIEKGAREEDIEAVKGQVKQAEAALDLARAQAETKTWEKDIALAESQVEAASAALRSAEALEAAKSWEAEITYAKTAATQAKAALDLARRMVADATIRAPIAGIVSRRYLDQGAKASPAAPIFEIVDVKKVKAVVSVLESDLGKLSLRDKASVQVDALTEPVSGEVSLISPIIEPAKRSAKVEIMIDNESMDLRPGMFAGVRILVEAHDNVVLIPRSAVIEDLGSPSAKTGIAVVVEDGVSKRRQVQLGLVQGNVVEITRGLTEGESVVTAGQHSLQDGEKVTVVKP
jgi:RND family efflux transporter MFP subunit